MKETKKSPAVKTDVPVAVVRRLPRYHRILGELIRKGKMRTNSAELSALMGTTASQIRQDFNYFGGYGQQGYGYNVRYLHEKIGDLLGVNEGFGAVILGAGHLGCALVNSHMFERRGVARLAMFDVDPRLIGTEINGVPVLDVRELPDYCRTHRVAIGVLTTPKTEAEGVARTIAEAGVGGIWNFSNMELSLPDYPDVIIENIHLGDSLMQLCFALKLKNTTGEN